MVLTTDFALFLLFKSFPVCLFFNLVVLVLTLCVFCSVNYAILVVYKLVLQHSELLEMAQVAADQLEQKLRNRGVTKRLHHSDGSRTYSAELPVGKQTAEKQVPVRNQNPPKKSKKPLEQHTCAEDNLLHRETQIQALSTASPSPLSNPVKCLGVVPLYPV